jgi:hypothetical protein
VPFRSPLAVFPPLERQMPFVFPKIFDHGSSNPIVARLFMQTLEIIKFCDIAEHTKRQVVELYRGSLTGKLLHCWEIKERLQSELSAAMASTPTAVNFPYILRLEEECRTFLYEIKNYVRDLLKVFNLLYGTNFKEAREFSRPKKKAGVSLVEFASESFGADDSRTKFFKEAVKSVEYFVDHRNAVEHPGGHSGELVIKNITWDANGKATEPVWVRVKDGVPLATPSSICSDMDSAIHHFLHLGEVVLVSWAAKHLRFPELMRVVPIPEENRNPKCPINFEVTVG